MKINALKVFKYLDRIQRISQGEMVFPVTIEIDPTVLCNCNCSWCINASLRTGAIHSLDWNRLKSFIQELKGTEVCSAVLKGGGEPMAYPHFSELLYELKAAGLKTGLITNGTLLNQHAEAVATCCEWVRVSLSAANRDVYFRTQRPQTIEVFDQVISNLESTANRVHTGICMVASPLTDDAVYGVAAIARNTGCAYIDIKLAHSKDKVPLSPDSLAKVTEQIDRAQREFGNALEILWNRVAEAESPVRYDVCKGHQLIGILCADGHFYSCCTKKGDREYSLGSIYDQSFETIWLGEQHRKICQTIDSGRCRNDCVGMTSFARYDYYNDIFRCIHDDQLRHGSFL